MGWKRRLTYITGSVNEELLSRIEYADIGKQNTGRPDQRPYLAYGRKEKDRF